MVMTGGGTTADLYLRDAQAVERPLGNQRAFAASVKISSLLGIDLSVDTNYASTRVAEYRVATPGKVCGNDAVPALAGRVMTSR